MAVAADISAITHQMPVATAMMLHGSAQAAAEQHPQG
jgi:hypothetical protein